MWAVVAASLSSSVSWSDLYGFNVGTRSLVICSCDYCKSNVAMNKNKSCSNCGAPLKIEKKNENLPDL